MSWRQHQHHFHQESNSSFWSLWPRWRAFSLNQHRGDKCVLFTGVSFSSLVSRYYTGIYRVFWIVLDSMARINETPDKSWKIEIIIALNNGQPNHIFHTVFGTKTLSQYNQIQSCSAWNGAVLSFKDNLLIFFFFFLDHFKLQHQKTEGARIISAVFL